MKVRDLGHFDKFNEDNFGMWTFQMSFMLQTKFFKTQLMVQTSKKKLMMRTNGPITKMSFNLSFIHLLTPSFMSINDMQDLTKNVVMFMHGP